MSALRSLVRIPTIPRRQRAAVTVTLGLSAGAVSWSELASAEGQQLQTLILPDHYQRLSDGSLVVSSWTGEQLVLSRDQFLELEGGLMLVVDDLAVGAIRQLPLVGTLETHLIADAYPVRSSDGTIIGTQTSSLLRSGEGTAPRLFEEVDIERYELAQDLSDSSPTMVSVAAAAGVGASGAGGGLLLGLALAGSGSASDGSAADDSTSSEVQPDDTAELPLQIWTNAAVPDNASVNITAATEALSIIGITPLTNLGRGTGSVATITMTARGDNLLMFGHDAAKDGQVNYVGGNDQDHVILGEDVADNGSIFFDMSSGGNNIVDITEDLGDNGGHFQYFGGADRDTIIARTDFMPSSGEHASVDMSAGGDNLLAILERYSLNSETFQYQDGDGRDIIIAGIEREPGDGTSLKRGDKTFDMRSGGQNFFTAETITDASSGPSFSYLGGSGQDFIGLGGDVVRNVIPTDGSSVRLDAGADSVADFIVLGASVGEGADTGSVVIENFDLDDGDGIILANMQASTASFSIAASGGVQVTGGSGTVNFVLDGHTEITAIETAVQDSAAGLVIGSALPDQVWTNDMVAESADVVIVGTEDDSLVGLTALHSLGRQTGNTATIDMSAGGQNIIIAGYRAGASGGRVEYVSGPSDTLAFGRELAKSGSASFDMSLGEKTLVALAQRAAQSGTLSYTGGNSEDYISGGMFFAMNGSATFDMKLGGDNTLVSEDDTASNSGNLIYFGGSGSDTIVCLDDAAAASGTLVLNMLEGGTNILSLGNNAAASSGSISYLGGSGKDILGFGDNLAENGTAILHLGSDTAADRVFFDSSVGAASGSVIIQNFDASDGDEITVNALSTASVSYSVSGIDDVLVSGVNGTATVTFIIEDTTISALSSSHYNSGTGLVIS